MNKMHTYQLKKDARGFTVIELMIAISVFSVVLLTITMAILQMSRIYYRGVVTTNTQNTARQIMDTLSQAVQFSGDEIVPTAAGGTSQPTGTNLAFCIGSKKYSYVLGRALHDGPKDDAAKRSPHVLIEERSSADCPSATPAPYNMASQAALGANARELMSPNMRLTDLRVYEEGDLYRITVRIISGDADVLTDPDAADARCKGDRFTIQYCAVSELSTVVTKRIGNTP